MLFLFKGTICNFSALKIAEITISMLYIFFSCVLTLSRQFPRTFKSGENYSLIRRHGTFLYFRFVARLWRHITFDLSSFSNFLRNTVEPPNTKVNTEPTEAKNRRRRKSSS